MKKLLLSAIALCGVCAANAGVDVSNALATYAKVPGWHPSGSTERAALLHAINQAANDRIDATALAAAVTTYTNATCNNPALPVEGKEYYIIGTTTVSGAYNERYMYYDETDEVCYVNALATEQDKATDTYIWTVENNESGKILIKNKSGKYLQYSTEASYPDENGKVAKAQGMKLSDNGFAFTFRKGLKAGLVELYLGQNKDNASEAVCLDSRTNGEDASLINKMYIRTNSENQNNTSNSKFSSNWYFVPVDGDTMLTPYTLTVANHDDGGLVCGDNVLADGATLYIDGATHPYAQVPTEYVTAKSEVNAEESTVTLTYHGPQVGKLYNIVNADDNSIKLGLSATNTVSSTSASLGDPAFIFTLTHQGDGKYSLGAQGRYIQEQAQHTENNSDKKIVGSSETPCGHYIFSVSADKTCGGYVIDSQHNAQGGYSIAHAVHKGDNTSNGNCYVYGTYADGAHWTFQEVTSLNVNTDVTASTDKYKALCMPFDFTVGDDVTVFDVVMDGAKAKAVKTNSTTVKAGTPVILHSEDATIALTPSAPQAESSADETGVASATALTGNYFAAAAPENAFVLSADSNGNPVFTKATSLPANSAYIVKTDSDTDIPTDFSAVSTALTEIGTDAGPAAIYDLLGRRLLTVRRGLNISAGKVVLIR